MPSDDELSRRAFLRGLPRLFGRSLEAARDGVKEGISRKRADLSARRLTLPEHGSSLDGIPAVHPWIAIAHALAERTGRRVPYVLPLGGSGEAFRIGYDREDPARGMRESPVNSFLAALAIAGLTGQGMQGGPFEPAIGGVEASMAKGFSVVVGSGGGPAVLTAVDLKASQVEWVRGGDVSRRLSFEEFEREWEAASWSAGPAPYLRVTVERGQEPQPLEKVARAGILSMGMLLRHEGEGSTVGGLAAWEAWAEDLRADAISAERAEALHGEWLERIGVGRLAAGRFFDAIARAMPPDEREAAEKATRIFREIHEPDPTGEVWGTGLLPEVAQCLTTDGRPDPEKLVDPVLRERAAGLIDEIHALESKALDLANPAASP
jgi:hypothetical protein